MDTVKMLTRRSKALKEKLEREKSETAMMDQARLSGPTEPQDFQPMDSEDDSFLTVDISDNPEEDQNLLFCKVFSNDLLWGKISSYLNPTDMKAASVVNKLFLEKVRMQKIFMDRLKLIICRESFKKKVLSRTRLKWKRGDIELSTLPSKALPSIRRILQSIESLELYEAYGVSEKDRQHFLKEIIPNSPNLRSLTLDCSIVERLNGSLLAEPEIRNHLMGLEELRIVTGRYEEARMVSCSDGARSTFPQNILKLSQIPMKLKSFVFQKIDTYYGNQKEHVSFIPQLVQKNQSTLTELTLQLHVWSLDAMKNVVCPSLKKLHITAYRRNDVIVKTFIQQQPLLETLAIQFKNGFPLSVLKAIANKGTKLKKLHLKAASFTDSPDLIDWSFLINCKALEDFEIFQPRAFIGQNETQGTVSQYLNALPDSVRRISLRGLEHGWAGNITTNTTTCLQRFLNITNLSLMRCEETINDEILQFVCSTLTKLKLLQFSHNQTLTDFGLTGMREDGTNSGISLKNLKGLRHLTMRECRQITEGGLVASVEFLELVKLDIAIRNAPLAKATLLQLVRQNPSLENLSIHFPLEEVEKDLKQVNSRLKRVSCVQEDWGVEDSDSDAEEFDEEFESSDDGSFDSWDWDSSEFDDDDLVLEFHGPFSDFSDEDGFG